MLPNENVTISSVLMNAIDTTNTTGFNDIDGGISATEVRVQYRVGHLPGGVNGTFLYFFRSDFTDLGSRLIVRPGVG